MPLTCDSPKNSIAILGNMNNVGFSLLRYFHDLGASAHLLPYSTDGNGGLAHFTPAADTWCLDRWKPWVHSWDVPNTAHAIIGRRGVLTNPWQRHRVRKRLGEFRYLIGSGIAPALTHGTNRRLDVFFPYATGVEFLGEVEFRRRVRSTPVRRALLGAVRSRQVAGILAANECCNSEMSITKQALDNIGRSFTTLALPALYNRDPIPATIPWALRAQMTRMRNSDLAILCSSRQSWVRTEGFSESDWRSFTKNSDWLFRGIAELVRDSPSLRPLLTVVQYGPDWLESRRLAGELGISEYVQWLPVMPRRELLLLLQACDVAVGEFKLDPGIIWGSTGWEALAIGKPILQSLNFSFAEFTCVFNHPPPPICHVTQPSDVAQHLSALYRDSSRRSLLGNEGLRWFNTHNGIGLANRWLELLKCNEA